MSDLSHMATLREQRDARTGAYNVCADRLREAVNRHCSCGGRPSDDMQACDACRIWHEWCNAMEAAGCGIPPF